ncbi:hypothetical protein Tco_1492341 [Tanacetum coccineum]
MKLLYCYITAPPLSLAAILHPLLLSFRHRPPVTWVSHNNSQERKKLIAFLKKQIADSRRPKVHDCPCLDAVFLVADSKFLKVAFGVDFKILLFNPLVFSTKDLSRNLKLTVYVVPTGKDNVIVSAGRTKVIPAGSTILVLVVLCLLLRVSVKVS